MLAECFAEIDKDRRGLFELAGIWALAALLERASGGCPDTNP
jgi:hypothetical protein